jgi:hypothetical protein
MTTFLLPFLAAGVILDDEIDCLADDGGAMLLDIEPDAGLDLLPDRGQTTREGQHDTDLQALRSSRLSAGFCEGRNVCASSIT